MYLRVWYKYISIYILYILILILATNPVCPHLKPTHTHTHTHTPSGKRFSINCRLSRHSYYHYYYKENHYYYYITILYYFYRGFPFAGASGSQSVYLHTSLGGEVQGDDISRYFIMRQRQGGNRTSAGRPSWSLFPIMLGNLAHYPLSCLSVWTARRRESGRKSAGNADLYRSEASD